MTESINSLNWNHTHYISGPQKAFISIGASEDILEDEFIYFVTIADEEGQDLFQKEFNDISMACDYINDRFKDDWDFSDLSLPPKSDKEGGCSTCVAH